MRNVSRYALTAARTGLPYTIDSRTYISAFPGFGGWISNRYEGLYGKYDIYIAGTMLKGLFYALWSLSEGVGK